jgi:glycosyltransferase involved in cell wall biosynthesis
MSTRQKANHPDTIVISPSGNFYGSEQVLFDYLKNTSFTYHVFVPEETVFLEKVKTTVHQVSTFGSVRSLYFRVSRMLLTGKYKTVYINEAGHSNYVHLLAHLFRKVRFVVHVRIMEDTEPVKWRHLRKHNTTLVTISDFVQKTLKPASVVIRDLFDFPTHVPRRTIARDKALEIAIIGRISYTKGFKSLVALSRAINEMHGDRKLILNLYGDVSDDVKADADLAYLRTQEHVRFHGFVNNKQIYDQNDLVLHLSKTEPLGRIFFEAISSGRPLVGFNAGGIGEIARLSGLSDFMVEESENEANSIIDKIISIAYSPNVNGAMDKAISLMKEAFSVECYVNDLDKLIMKNPV